MRKLHQDKYTVKDIVNTMKKISPKKTDKTPVRIGKESDGGYILLDELLKGGVAYSFGVGSTSAFERDMAKRGYVNHMYDHTVPKAHAVGDQFIFNRYGVGAKDGGQLKTIETIVRENKHENYNNIILQCDVEGAEYDIFTNTPQDILKCFSQIIVEYHSLDKCILDMTNFKRGRMEHWHYQKMKDTFSVLAENFTPYHVHGNNFILIHRIASWGVSEKTFSLRAHGGNGINFAGSNGYSSALYNATKHQSYFIIEEIAT